MMLRMKSRLPWNWYRLSILVVIADQLVKRLVVAKLGYGQPVEILPVFNLTLQYNTGAAFSFLHDAGGWQRWFFSALAMVVSAVLAVWMARLQRHQRLLLAGLGLIVGGALGNLVDRLRFGYVVDFLSAHWGEHYFPAFNVADSAITIGAGLLLLDMLLHPEQHRDRAAGGNSGD